MGRMFNKWPLSHSLVATYDAESPESFINIQDWSWLMSDLLWKLWNTSIQRGVHVSVTFHSVNDEGAVTTINRDIRPMRSQTLIHLLRRLENNQRASIGLGPLPPFRRSENRHPDFRPINHHSSCRNGTRASLPPADVIRTDEMRAEQVAFWAELRASWSVPGLIPNIKEPPPPQAGRGQSNNQRSEEHGK